MQRWLKGLAGMVVVIALEGCAIASTMRAYDVVPNGLERGDQALRDLLAQANGDAGVIGNHGKLPTDALLRALYEGTLAYYAGDYSAAVKRFDAAYAMTEDRYTKSLARGAMALAVNDRALDYLPGQNERLFIHYYAALAYLKKGEPEGAAVEARRLVYQLQQLDEKSTDRDRQTRAMLRYFAGAVFEAAGEDNDALVAYRNAALALGDTAGARRQTLTPEGKVLVIVEQGFVAHRVNQSIWVELGRNESQLFVKRDDDRYRRGAWGVASRVESSLATRDDAGLFVEGAAMRFSAPQDSADTLEAAPKDSLIEKALPVKYVAPDKGLPLPPVADATKVSLPAPKKAKGPDGWIKEHILKDNAASGAMSESSKVVMAAPGRRRKGGDFDQDDYMMRVSLPAFHRTRLSVAPAVTLGDSIFGARVSASLSEAVVADYARQRNAVLARAVARAATRYVVNNAVEKKAKEKWGETTGDIVGMLAQATGSALERADTRSWHLLPERVSIVRMDAVEAAELKVGGMVSKAPKNRAARLDVRSHRVWMQPGW